MQSFDKLTIDVDQVLKIKAPVQKVYESLVHQMSEGLLGQDDEAIGLKLEKKPGGRWYRDLGDGKGHLWGFVQSIRTPDLIELNGPMFMSYPVTNHIIARLEESDGGTRLHFRHRALGLIEEEHREGLVEGWNKMFDRIKKVSE